MSLFFYGLIAGIGITLIVFWFVQKMIAKSYDLRAKEGLDQTIAPFRERIDEYHRSLLEFKDKSIEQSAVLQTELKHVMQMAQKMESETRDLTQALKGDVKAQGDWGEFILERSLEIAGLVNGREYVLQGAGMNLRDTQGNLFKPDAVIHLPGNAHIIVDSKVSLKGLQEQDLKEIKRSLTAHIDQLSAKAYQKLEGISGPDFVMMFIPLESIMPLIFREFPEILEHAAKKNIVLTTPISILPILKTIVSLWRLDNQNKNADEIAKRAGLLYDKFVGFYQDMQKTQELFKKASDSHNEALKKLSEGQGNIIGKVEELRTLGAKTSKELL
jgi:DNA recombination protein RmuC